MTERERDRKAAKAPARDALAELAVLEAWNAARQLKDRGLPAAWDDLAWQMPARPPRMRLTVEIDADVAEWFRRIDPEQAEAMNAVLRIYMLGVQSKEIDAP